jgi:copper transport protein
MRRVGIVAAIALAVACAWLGVGAAPAGAHAAIEETDPANGAVLEAAPDEISLSFTEPPDLSLTTIGIDGGVPVPTGPYERVAGTERTIRVPVPDLADGVYTVTWRTVSTTDGHVTAGAFSFGVGVSAGEVDAVVPGDGTETPPPTPLAVAGRWGLYAGLAVLFGAAVCGLVAFGVDAVARPGVLAIAWIVAAVGVVAMTLEERAALSVPLGTLLSSEAGSKFAWLAVAVGVAGVATLVVSLKTSRATLIVLATATSAAMLSRVLGGHAGGSPTSIGAQWLHMMAVGAWIGGLAWLVLALRRGLAASQVRRYSNLAAGGLALLFVSGVLRATNELGGLGWWLDPFENDYSTALVVKLAIVAPLVAFGARNRFRNVPRFERLGSRPLLRTVGAELGLAAGVFALTGVLTGLPPQEGVHAPLAQRPLVVTGSDFATTTRVRLQIAPGTIGPNEFVAEVTDYDTGEPVDAQRVALEFELPERPEFASALELQHSHDGSWRADATTLAVDGTWDVTVLVEGGGDSTTVALQVTPRTPEPRVEVSRVPGQPDLYTIFLGDGLQLQAYVDPGEAGRTNQLHVTAFDADGAELPLRSGVVEVTPPGDATFEPDLLRFGPGHFAANIELTAGTWTFDTTVTAEDGRVLSASFEQTFDA